MTVRKTSICPSGSIQTPAEDEDFNNETFVPHFQRVNISGEDITGYSAEELRSKSVLLQEAILLRQKYMKMSKQNFSADCDHFLNTSGSTKMTNGVSRSKISLKDYQVHAPKSSGNHWECNFPPNQGYFAVIEKGVFQIYKNKEDMKEGSSINFQYPTLDVFIRDLQKMCTLIADGPLKTFCYKRLVYLSSKFQLHGLLNEIR